MKPHKIFQSAIRDRTRMLLAEYLKLKVHTYEKISKDTGLSDNWIGMFNRGDLKHTDIGRVEHLHDYISPVKLKDIIAGL